MRSSTSALVGLIVALWMTAMAATLVASRQARTVERGRRALRGLRPSLQLGPGTTLAQRRSAGHVLLGLGPGRITGERAGRAIGGQVGGDDGHQVLVGPAPARRAGG